MLGSMARVLVLDEPEVAHAVCDVLRERGHDPFVADLSLSDRAAADLAVIRQADAVIVGIRSYDLDGLSVAEAVRRIAPPSMRLIAFGVSQKEMAAVSKQDLFDAYLPRPVTIEALQRAIERA